MQDPPAAQPQACHALHGSQLPWPKAWGSQLRKTPNDNKQPGWARVRGAGKSFFWKGRKRMLEFVLAVGNPGAKLNQVEPSLNSMQSEVKAAWVSRPPTPWPWLLMFFQTGV